MPLKRTAMAAVALDCPMPTNGLADAAVTRQHDDSEKALARLRELGKAAHIGQILSPTDEAPWNADENNL